MSKTEKDLFPSAKILVLREREREREREIQGACMPIYRVFQFQCGKGDVALTRL